MDCDIIIFTKLHIMPLDFLIMCLLQIKIQHQYTVCLYVTYNDYRIEECLRISLGCKCYIVLHAEQQYGSS